jgi:all-trans-8'-apo-beta-carotenal 15,15'-oxygenase
MSEELDALTRDTAGGFEAQREELSYWIDDIEGTIPSELQGTYFRNGPGQLDVNGQTFHHFIDGDGMVTSVAFKDGRAYFRNRFVRTEGFLAEQKAGRILYRSPFGTQKPGGWTANMFDFSFKNTANSNVVYWGDKLLALWEAGEPHRLDPHTLETMYKDDLGGILSPGPQFSAHPRIDPYVPADGGKPHFINFGVNMGLLRTTITLYEFNPAGELVHRHAYGIPGFGIFHDMSITPNYATFFQTPLKYDALPYVLGFQGITQSIELDKSKRTNIVILPRDPDGTVHSFQTRTGFIFHYVNAFEQGEDLCVDAVCYDRFPNIGPKDDFRKLGYRMFPAGHVRRFTINTRTGKVEQDVLETRSCEFPRLNPYHEGRAYRYVYMTAASNAEGHGPHQAIMKKDMQTGVQQLWSGGERTFVGEPVFIPRVGMPGSSPDGMDRQQATTEDDGWVITMIYDAEHHRTDIVLLDARDLNKGPVARMHLKHHIPHGFHGSFTNSWFGPEVN